MPVSAANSFPALSHIHIVLSEQILRVSHIEVPNFAMKVSESGISEAQGRTVENSKFHDIIFLRRKQVRIEPSQNRAESGDIHDLFHK